MSRHDDQRLADILAAADAIADHLQRGDLDDGLVFDAVPLPDLTDGIIKLLHGSHG